VRWLVGWRRATDISPCLCCQSQISTGPACSVYDALRPHCVTALKEPDSPRRLQKRIWRRCRVGWCFDICLLRYQCARATTRGLGFPHFVSPTDTCNVASSRVVKKMEARSDVQASARGVWVRGDHEEASERPWGEPASDVGPGASGREISSAGFGACIRELNSSSYPAVGGGRLEGYGLFFVFDDRRSDVCLAVRKCSRDDSQACARGVVTTSFASDIRLVGPLIIANFARLEISEGFPQRLPMRSLLSLIPIRGSRSQPYSGDLRAPSNRRHCQRCLAACGAPKNLKLWDHPSFVVSGFLGAALRNNRKLRQASGGSLRRWKSTRNSSCSRSSTDSSRT